MRRRLSGRDYAIVARATGADNLVVVHGVGRDPDIGRMAIFTNVSRKNMSRVLAGCFNPVVAAGAIARYADVIEVGGQPTDRCMTVVAVVAARNMRRMLARRCCAVVARAAGAKNLRVIDRISGCEYVRVVAVLANIRCLDM